MNQEEVVENFLTEQTASWLEEDIPLMEQEFSANKEQIVASLSNSIGQLCREYEKEQESGNKGPAAHLCISFLRTHILEEDWRYRLVLYDEKSYLDLAECTINWELEFVWKYLKTRLNELRTIVKTGIYVNTVKERHLSQVKLEMAEQYHQIGMICTKLVIADAIQVPEYRTLQKVANFKIGMGEYRDKILLIYEEPFLETQEVKG